MFLFLFILQQILPKFFFYNNFVLVWFAAFSFVLLQIDENFNRYGRYFALFFFSLFSFLLFSNVLSMVPYSFALTSHFIITLLFSFIIFFSSVFFGFYLHGLHFWALFMPSGAPFGLAPFLITIEIISFSARLFSLAIRLFANIMSGHTLLNILAGFSISLFLNNMLGISFIPLIIIFVVSFLELAIAFLQAYVFITLGLIYLQESFLLHGDSSSSGVAGASAVVEEKNKNENHQGELPGLELKKYKEKSLINYNNNKQNKT